MKQWVLEQGMTIEREYQLGPTVVVVMAADEDLVARVRRHENVDVLEPVTRGVFLGGGPSNAGSLALTAVINTSRQNKDALQVRADDTVTAEYRQPDGTVLTTTVLIRD